MTETITTLPQNNLTFELDTINFLANEDAARFNKQFAGFIYLGGTAPISASLSHTVAALEAFVHGYYVQQPATLITYIANRRTYVFVDSVETRSTEVVASGGAGATFKLRSLNLVVIECDIGSSQPTLSVPGLVALFYADTDATAITNVTDLRNLSPIVSSTKTIDPERYGLIGDNLTDNLIPFQAMINALPSGSVIRFGQGIYRFSGKIVVPKTCIIEGAGNSQLGTVLRITNATQDAIEITSTEQVILRNFVLDASVTRSGGSGVLISGNAILHRIDNVTFDGHQTQISIDSGRGWSITGCNFLNTTNVDIYVQTAIISPDVDGVISSNIFSNGNTSFGFAIKITKAIGLTITNNRFIGYNTGILIDPTSVNSNSITINQNTFRGQGAFAIALQRTGGSARLTEFELANNIIVGAGTIGILTEASAADVFAVGTISGNVISMSGAGDIGIQLNGDGGILVEGNNINLPGAGSVCLKVMGNSNAANIGHNGYVGTTFLLYSGTNAVVTPYHVPFVINVDPPSIAALTQVEVITAMTGARTTDIVVMKRPPLANLPATIAYVGASINTAGFLSIYLLNISGAPVDPGLATWIGYLLRTPA